MSRSIARTTVSCFSYIFLFETIFCINRTYLFSNAQTRAFCNIVSVTIFSSIIIVTVYSVLNDTIILRDKIFQAFLASEFLFMVVAARISDETFVAFTRLDERCGVHEQLIRRLEKEVKKQCIIGVASTIIDTIGMYFLDIRSADIFKYVILFAAREAETILFALIIEGMNLRLMDVSSMSPAVGSRVYRHVLIASNQMNEEYTLKMLIMLGVTLVTSTCYACAVMLMYSEKGVQLVVYLFWRELKSIYCVWKLCQASHCSERICQQLAFHLARRLALDPAYDKDKHPRTHAAAHRWCRVSRRLRPRHVRGSVFCVDHTIPLHLLDMTVNYVLIIIQIYVAYK